MFYLVSVAAGAGIAYGLIESGYAIHALIGLLIWIVLLWTVPQLSFWFVVVALGLGLALLMWEYIVVVLGVALGIILFLAIVGGLIHAGAS